MNILVSGINCVTEYAFYDILARNGFRGMDKAGNGMCDRVVTGIDEDSEEDYKVVMDLVIAGFEIKKDD